MPRLSTRIKRHKGMTTSRKHRFWKGTTPGRQRLKSFATKAAAEAWAKGQKLEGLILRELHPGKWQWTKKNKQFS